MENFQSYGLAYVVDDYFDMNEFDEPVENITSREGDTDSDVENDMKLKMDTSALDARNGKDIQGIPWERLNMTRDRYRQIRLKQYKNYENLQQCRDKLEKECKHVERGSNFYDFQYNTRLVKSTIVHFQLRNLLWATSKHDVYLMQNFSVMHWSSVFRRGKDVLNMTSPVVPTLKQNLSYQQLSRVQVSTMSVKHNLIAAGGFHGELVCKDISHSGVDFAAKIASDESAITNSVDIYQNSSGSTRLMTANNDCKVRIFDVGGFALLSSFTFPWSVNNTSVSPDGRLIAVLGDSSDVLIADAVSGKNICTLSGHLDYSFASAWAPDGCILSTGNQDMTCRLWDMRKACDSVAVLKGRMGAIRAVKYSADGQFMAVAEPADFVHIFDTRSNYMKAQEIDLFGEVAGISFSPDAEALFVGIADRTYGSLLEFKRKHCYGYIDCFL